MVVKEPYPVVAGQVGLSELNITCSRLREKENT